MFVFIFKIGIVIIHTQIGKLGIGITKYRKIYVIVKPAIIKTSTRQNNSNEKDTSLVMNGKNINL